MNVTCFQGIKYFNIANEPTIAACKCRWLEIVLQINRFCFVALYPFATEMKWGIDVIQNTDIFIFGYGVNHYAILVGHFQILRGRLVARGKGENKNNE